MLKRILMTQWLVLTVMLLTLGVVTPARADDLDGCNPQAANPDLGIGGFTELIEAGRLTSNSLAVAYYRRGTAYYYLGDLDRAVADIDRAIQINPNFSFARENRDLAIQINPNFSFAYEIRNMAYREKGDIERAAADCDKARQIDPDTKR